MHNFNQLIGVGFGDITAGLLIDDKGECRDFALIGLAFEPVRVISLAAMCTNAGMILLVE
jgi:hypothetical protein